MLNPNLPGQLSGVTAFAVQIGEGRKLQILWELGQLRLAATLSFTP